MVAKYITTSHEQGDKLQHQQHDPIHGQHEDQQPHPNGAAHESKFHKQITEIARLMMKHHKSSKLESELKKKLSDFNDKLRKKTEKNEVLQQELIEAMKKLLLS